LSQRQQVACALADEEEPPMLAQSQRVFDAAKPSGSGRKSAQRVAAEHKQEVAIVRDLLKKQGLTDLPPRLNSGDAELIR